METDNDYDVSKDYLDAAKIKVYTEKMAAAPAWFETLTKGYKKEAKSPYNASRTTALIDNKYIQASAEASATAAAAAKVSCKGIDANAKAAMSAAINASAEYESKGPGGYGSVGLDVKASL